MQRRALIAIVLLLSACKANRAEVVAAVEATVVKQVREMMPGATIGAVDCPHDLRLGPGQQAHSGRNFDIEVSVVGGMTGGTIYPVMQGTFINVETIEQLAATQAQILGGPETRLSCGEPRLRLFAVGDEISCTASRPGWSHDWKLKVENVRGLI